MLHNVKKLDRCRIIGQDGDLGGIKDIYFDDERWVIRYLVVDTGGWLTGRKVLVSPYAVKLVDLAARAVVVNLTRDQVERSPGIDADKPVSRRQEADYFSYYGYPGYWTYTTAWAWGGVPVLEPPYKRTHEETAEHTQTDRSSDSGDADSVTHLRSSNEVLGYRIQAADETVGHVEDFAFDDDTWAIRYLIVDTRNWLPGKHVLVSLQWIRSIEWATKTVHVALSKEEIERSPQYDPQHLPPRAVIGDLRPGQRT